MNAGALIVRCPSLTELSGLNALLSSELLYCGLIVPNAVDWFDLDVLSCRAMVYFDVCMGVVGSATCSSTVHV